MKYILILFLFASLSISSTDQNGSKDYYYDKELGNCLKWNKRKLLSDDFKGKPPEGNTFGAETFFAYDYKEIVTDKNSNYVILIYTTFLVDDSWKRSIILNDTLLNHEQRHLDVAEIHCRLFKKDLQKQKYSTNNEFVDIYTKKLYEYIGKSQQMNNLYDTETKHGVLLDKQKKWDKKIDDLLKKYAAYSNDTVVVKRMKK